MSTYTQIYYHIIFGTKNRKHTLQKEKLEEIYRYILGITRNKKCKLYQIDGITNHIHLLIDLHPTEALSSLIKDIKIATGNYIRSENLSPKFHGWQNDYGAFTCTNKERDLLINYIKNQEEHHKNKTFKEEFIELLEEHEIKYNEKYQL